MAPTGLFPLAWLLIAVPLVSAAILLLAGKAANSWGHYLGTLAPIVSFVVALALFADLLGRPEAQHAVSVPLYTWIATGSWSIGVGLLIDPLSILFALLITGVGSLIHVYSIGYMAHDPGRRRFFAYLNFFIAAMLTLVLADNYAVLFVGWEGVGLASYLLISFWQHKPTAATAGKKAFVVNRVGDLGLTMAIFTMLAMFGSSSFEAVNAGASKMSPAWVTLLGMLLLVGACGKSAQVPLQSWLLDAMEGPTPVSALIHAATMVTAGVYLVIRSHAIYAQTSAAALAVAIVGTVTLLAGAWIGTSKDDIKKVLAGSTMSQIGYMMLAAGIGPIAYPFAIFHLLVHGFFKANMFLGAGSVMHGMNDDVNMRHYGGLAKVMKITYYTFLMGYLAIIGTPFFSGFYSKDSIIEAAWEKQPVLGALALIAAGITAFYMTRLMFMTFWSSKRWAEGVHPHDPSALMTWPMIVLAAGSAVLGGALAVGGAFTTWLQPMTGAIEHHDPVLPVPVIMVTTFALIIAGAFLAWRQYAAAPVAVVAPRGSLMTRAARRDLYQDDVAEVALMRPGQYLTRSLVYGDRQVVDGTVSGDCRTGTSVPTP